MHLPRLRRPRYAEVVATLALFVGLGGTAYAVGTVNTADIVNGAVTTPKIASEAVTNAKLAPDAVTSGKVAANSLTLGDLKGTNQSGFISFKILAHSCGKLTFGVSGAAAGQAAVLTWMPTGDSIPTRIVVGPLEVVSASTIVGYACNNSGTDITRSHLGVRVVTFG
jgi:hypothetical protein